MSNCLSENPPLIAEFNPAEACNVASGFLTGPPGAPGNNTSSGVATFNTRTGDVTLSSADVQAALGYLPAQVVSPAFGGTPTAPTATAGNNSTQLATTAFVQAALAALNTGVVSFNSRTGAVTLTSLDVTNALGFTPANLVSPVFTGTPTAPTPSPGTNDTKLATTAFVAAAVSAATAGVASFNGRTGTVTPVVGDYSGFYAPLSHTHAQSDITGLVAALAAKEATIAAGTTAQYWRGDKSWQTLNAAAVGLGNVPNVDPTNAANITSGTLPDARISATWATRAYVESLVVGLLDDRGNHDASGNTYPTTGGSGASGAILKGDLWTISVPGSLGGVAVSAGDVIRALVDTPGSTPSNWAITENNIGYTPLNASLNSGQIYVGNVSNLAQARTMSGDATISNAGVLTLANSGVTANSYGTASVVPALTVDAKGRISSVTATPIALPLSSLTQSSATTGQVPQWNGSAWVAASVSSTPGGSVTQLQFNNAGAFGGISGATSDGTNVTFGAGNLRATTPRFTTGIFDANGNGIFNITPTASAVNGLTIANAATGNSPTWTATGSDANVGVNYVMKGSGKFVLTGNQLDTLTITTGASNTAGLKFTNLTSLSTYTSNLQPLGVDSNGIVRLHEPIVTYNKLGTSLAIDGSNIVDVNQAYAFAWTALHTHNLGTSPQAAIRLVATDLTTNTTRDSHYLEWRAQGRNSGSITYGAWRLFANATDLFGSSGLSFRNAVSATPSSYTEVFRVNDYGGIRLPSFTIGSPAAGDLWRDGSSLKFFDGSSTITLGSGGGGGGVPSITGTANQVLVNSTSGSAVTTAATLTLPQSIATSSAVQFGAIGIGAAAGSFPFLMSKEWGGVSSANVVTSITSYGDSNRYALYAAGGTLASPTATPSGTQLFNLQGRGYDGSTWSSTSRGGVAVFAAETFTSTAQGTYLAFNTTKTGETSVGERARIHSNGFLGVNTTAPDTQLHVATSSGSAIKAEAPSGTAPIITPNMHSTSTNLTGNVKKVVVNSSGQFGVADEVLTATNTFMNIPNVFTGVDVAIGVTSANLVLGFTFDAAHGFEFNRMTFRGRTAQSGGNACLQIRSIDGATVLWSSGAMSTTSWANANVTVSFTAFTLPKGQYWLVWSMDNTLARWQGAQCTQNIFRVFNGNGSGCASFANAASGGVPPSTLGAATYIDLADVPVVKFWKA